MFTFFSLLRWADPNLAIFSTQMRAWFTCVLFISFNESRFAGLRESWQSSVVSPAFPGSAWPRGTSCLLEGLQRAWHLWRCGNLGLTFGGVCLSWVQLDRFELFRRCRWPAGLTLQLARARAANCHPGAPGCVYHV